MAKQSDVEWAVWQARRWLDPNTGLKPSGRYTANKKKLRMARALLELHFRLESLSKQRIQA